VVLIAEDDEDDRKFVESSMKQMSRKDDIIVKIVCDGDDAIDYLYQKGKYDSQNAPKPHIIFVDINMPKKDGIQLIREIKQDESLAYIPIIILTSSQSERDVKRGYSKGASSYITKPSVYKEYEEIMKRLETFWFSVARIPNIPKEDSKNV
jgi:CheY-like chemotaxis protein